LLVDVRDSTGSLEYALGELRRISLPRTPVNKDIAFGFIADSSSPVTLSARRDDLSPARKGA
jgi:hypothetical protein